jgi:hypothetical protein
MPATATIARSQNTTNPEMASAPEVVSAPEAQMPGFAAITAQQHIWRTAPDNDAALRLLYADLLMERALLAAENTRLQLALQATQVPATAVPATARRQRPPLRPHIVALLRERGTPMTRIEIEAALDLGPLNDALNGLRQLGRVTLANAKYALVPEAAAPAAPADAAPPARVKRGRPRGQDAA